MPFLFSVNPYFSILRIFRPFFSLLFYFQVLSLDPRTPRRLRFIPERSEESLLSTTPCIDSTARKENVDSSADAQWMVNKVAEFPKHDLETHEPPSKSSFWLITTG